jgi:hypothetical protein
VAGLAYRCSSIVPVHGQTEKVAGNFSVKWRLHLTVFLGIERWQRRLETVS